LKRYIATMIVLIVIILVSAYYVFFRENEVEVHIEKSKFLFQQSIRNIDLESFPKNLQVEFEKILLKNNTLELKKEWSTNINFDLTLKPFFDLNNLYLVSYDKIIAYSKKTSEIKWKQQLEHKIMSFNLLDRNRAIVHDDSSYVYSFKRHDGELVWKAHYANIENQCTGASLLPFMITPAEDKRLLFSIFFLPQKRAISLINNDTGQLISTIEFDSELVHISDYDAFENSLYVVTGTQLLKLKLEKP